VRGGESTERAEGAVERVRGRREIMGGSWQKKVEKWATKKFKNNQRGRGGGGREMMMRM